MNAYGKTIIIREIKEEVKTSKGLIVTDLNDRDIRYKLGEVVSVGDEVVNISQGKMVYFDKTHAGDIRLDGKMYKIVNTNDIRVIL